MKQSQSNINESLLQITQLRPASASTIHRGPNDTYPDVKATSWFQYLKKNDKFKKYSDKHKPTSKTDKPFSLNSLEKEEQVLALPYYNRKLPMHTIPLFLHDIDIRISINISYRYIV